ncbi:MMPL family transporter [Dactylosporangium sp. NPDC000521]|uniref:MMPL family transporter n=1 Tax=Dactylosporangium sp. NPDC000521 TaxID=3363975 RepID=UPI0036790513
MFTRLGHLAVRRRRLLLAFTVLFIIAAGFAGVGVFGALGDAGLTDPGSESYRARQFLEDELGVRKNEAVLLVQAAGGGADTDDVDDPAVAAAATRLAESVRADAHVASVSSYWSLDGGDPRRATLRSTDGSAALVVLDLAGTDDEVKDAVVAIRDRYAGTDGPITVGLGGAAAINVAIGDQLDTDLIRAESLAIPVTLALLVFVFAGVVAAALPLAIATVSVTGAFLVLYVISRVTDVSAYSINLTTGLGFALAIDYSLFIVTRFREELAAGRSSDEAVVRTVETAGRTVAVSALTVAASLSALLVFPLYFLRSFAYAGIAVVVVAAAGSLLSLPALLAVLGPRVNAWSLRRARHPRRFWHRLASLVMRRPVPVATGVVVLLLLLGAPFLGVNPGLPSYQALPPSSEARQVADVLATRFAGNHSDQFAIVLPGVAAGDATAFADDVRTVHGVASVTVQQAEAGSWLTVVPSVPLRSAEGESLVRDLRGLDAPFAFGVEGRAAELVDTKAAIYDRLPLALGIIALATVVLLFAAFGSVLVPVKAVVLNLLSLTATFGAMVWVFQDGHLSGILGFTATGQLDVTMPILMFCIAFGLSIDYEVFLLSRIKEEYDHIGDNTRAVAAGLEKTGPLVTAAAAVLAISFTGFAAAGMSFMKLMGVGLALAIIMDATIIRGLLVPAFMRLAGQANWWAPAPLRRLHQRWGLIEAPTAPSDATNT